MRSAVTPVRLGGRPVADVLALAAGLLYVALLVGAFAAGWLTLAFWLLPAPFLLGAILLFVGKASHAQLAALGTAAVAAAAILAATFIVASGVAMLAVPALALFAVACHRYPGPSLIAVFALAGFFGSLQAFFGVPAPRIVDGLLAGLWLAAAWSWTMGGRERRRPLWIWPALIGVGVYVVLSAIEILVADHVTAGLQSFRASTWYLAVVLLIATAPWPAGTRERALRAVVAVAALVGAYATFRWLTGPAGAERELAESSPNNFLDGDLRPVGSFYTAKELAAWSAMAVPFLAGLALTWRGRWRMVAAAGCAACVVGMLAADVRAGPAAAVPATIVVLALYQAAQAFRGRRGPVVILAVAAVGLGGAGAFAWTLGDDPDAGRRYSAILDPERDPSYQGRLVKWRTALDDIERAPFGHGLGTSGRAQKRYGTFVNIGSIDVDNSYLKVAYEQGFLVMLGWAAVLLALLVGLARRAITSTDPARAGPAIAAAGTLVAMLILFWVGNYVEGLPALAGWVLVGLGVSAFTLRAPPVSGGEPAP